MSLTIKQAFEALSDACANGMKNPFFVMRRLKESFADVASKVVDASGAKVFIDTANKITSGNVKASFEYTATQDCFISLYCVGRAGVDGNIKIDNQSIGGWIFGGTSATTFHLYLKQGQVITATNLDTTYDSGYNVYALK